MNKPQMGHAGIGKSLAGSLASQASVPRMSAIGAAAIVAQLVAKLGSSSVSATFASPPTSASSTIGARTKLAGIAHGLSCSKWNAISGIDTNQAIKPAANDAAISDSAHFPQRRSSVKIVSGLFGPI